MAWTNADGLDVLMHGEQGEVKKNGGTIESMTQTLVVDITGTDLGTSADAPEANDAFIPAGSYIKNAYLVVDEAFTSGGAATLTIGTQTADGTNIDADGIDATVALTVIDASGDVVVADGAQVGGVVTVGANNAYVKAIYGTAAYTAGTAKLYVEYLPK